MCAVDDGKVRRSLVQDEQKILGLVVEMRLHICNQLFAGFKHFIKAYGRPRHALEISRIRLITVDWVRV